MLPIDHWITKRKKFRDLAIIVSDSKHRPYDTMGAGLNFKPTMVVFLHDSSAPDEGHRLDALFIGVAKKHSLG